MERILEVNIGMDQITQDDRFQGSPVLGHMVELDGEIIGLFVKVGIFIPLFLEGLVMDGPKENHERWEEDQEYPLAQKGPPEERRGDDEDRRHEQENVTGPHPGGQKKSGGECSQNGPEGGEGVNLAHHVPRPLYAVKG